MTGLQLPHPLRGLALTKSFFTQRMSKIYYTHLASPVGDFLVAGTDTEIHFTAFATDNQQRKPQSEWVNDAVPIRYAVDPLCAYFDGERVEFDLPLALVGTEFQCKVWTALTDVAYGQTASYGEIASNVRSPAASRAVGAANRANCIPIFIPCHRIIGANGSLTGFGGGLDTKAVLLDLERDDNQFELF